MTIITGTSGDDVVIIDNNVITVNGQLFTDTLTGISFNQGGSNTVIVRNSDITLEALQVNGDSNNVLEIVNSTVTIEDDSLSQLNTVGVTNGTFTATNSTIEAVWVYGGGSEGSEVTFVDSTIVTLPVSAGAGGRYGGIVLGNEDDTLTMIRSHLTGYDTSITWGFRKRG